MPSNPHHNPEIERRALSAMMYGAEEVNAAVRDGLTAEAFFEPRHAAIFKALVACAAENHATDVVTVWRRLSGMTGDNTPSAMQALSEIESLEPTSMRRGRFVADLVGLYRQRKLVSSLTDALQAASLTANSWGDVWENTEPHMRAAQESGSEHAEASTEQMAAIAADRILNGDKRAAIFTGLRGWDNDAGAIRAGQLAVIAARPGAGKTALALQMAGVNARESKGNVAFFSLEMSGDELICRMASTAVGARGQHDDKAKAAAAMEIGRNKALQIFEGRAASTIAQIESRSRLLACSPRGLKAVFIDYLQLITPARDTKNENREQQVATMSRRLKLMAGALQVPVVLLAQLNRESEKDQRRPRMSDLRESGAIEQDADVIWFLYQPIEKNSTADESASEIKVALYQAKRRNGRPGLETVLNFNRPIFQFQAA